MSAAPHGSPAEPPAPVNGSSVNAGALEALAAALLPLVAEQAAVDPDALLDAAGAARLLSVPESWVRAEARADRIPHVQLGRYVRFSRSDLIAWRDERVRGPRVQRTGSNPVSTGGNAR